MTRPFIKFQTLVNPSEYYEVRAGKVQRPFFDQTYKSHAYHCHALTPAHLNGWEIVLPQDITVIWDGILDSSPDHVKILSGEYLPDGRKLVQTDTGNSTLAFNLYAIIETDEEHDVVLTGAPNYFIDGAVPMTAIIQSNWYHHNPLQYCWRIVEPNREVTFPAGMPFVFMFNRPKTLVDNTDFSVSRITQEISDRITNYGHERTNFYANSEPWSWSHMYRNGVDGMSDDAKKWSDGPLRPKPMKPRYEE